MYICIKFVLGIKVYLQTVTDSREAKPYSFSTYTTYCMAFSKIVARLAQYGITTDVHTSKYIVVDIEKSINSKLDTRETIISRVKKEAAKESSNLHFFSLESGTEFVVSEYPEEQTKEQFDLGDS
jgi:hypothetical protein